VTGIELDARCGPLSTTITVELDASTNDYTSSPNYTPTDLTGTYSVTNAACGVIEASLTVGGDMWYVANLGSGTFEVRARSNPPSSGAYAFTVVLHAVGGATASVSNTV
jgi:hypothetical protein